MRLVAFDFDGTLSDDEMTVLLGEQRGTAERRAADGGTERVDVADEMAAITRRAMNDEIGYAESLRRRAALLEGLSESAADAAYAQVALRPGAAKLLRRLDDAGHRIAILTGGFERGVRHALDAADVEDAVDDVVANRLPVADGELTGAVEGPLIEGTKDTELERLGREADVGMERTVAVGDGANDLPMLEVAAYSVGFLPKDAVRPACDAVAASMYRLGKLFEERGMLAPRRRDDG